MNYYYLLSGLPDLSLDDSAKRIDFEETFDTIQRNLEPEDLIQYYYLLYPNDNRNFLSHLFEEFKDLPKAKFLVPGTLNPEWIQSYRHEQAAFPDYMVEYIQESEAQFNSLSMREMENRLQDKFEDQIDKRACSFIKDYFYFKRSLSAIVAAFNQARFSFLSNSVYRQDDPLLDALKSGKPPSSSILKTYPYAEQLKTVISTADPLQIEHFVEELEWEYLSGPHSSFGSDSILAYSSRLMMLLRKHNQDREKGEAHFALAKTDIRKIVHSHKTSLI